MARKLSFTSKQQSFIDCYDGDLHSTAKLSKISYDYCRKLYQKRRIKDAIRARGTVQKRNPKILTREKRQVFWSDVIRGKKYSMKDRLKASELLGKSEADFIDRVEGEVKITFASIMKIADTD